MLSVTEVHSYILSWLYVSFDVIDHNFISLLSKGAGYYFLFHIQVLSFLLILPSAALSLPPPPPIFVISMIQFFTSYFLIACQCLFFLVLYPPVTFWALKLSCLNTLLIFIMDNAFCQNTLSNKSHAVQYQIYFLIIDTIRQLVLTIWCSEELI